MEHEFSENTIACSRTASIEKAISILNNKSIPKEIIRPNVSLTKGILKCLAFLSVYTAIIIIKKLVFSNNQLYNICIVLSALVFISVNIRKILIWLVKIYQKYASAELRSCCVFTPSCSEYMILSLEKYGTIKGLAKGIKRLFRCRFPNSGIDNP
ncbi:membrane protein insertion efficiency factor YidD [Brucepastera parasyntrophica]|uniref:membrane protein insertion efficiency factor YidD n=1 Tax=Brucepastera parasyntrophica TaxID=2880008 RepID=UPI00210D72E8|nr:membrane protein insertion efficiency factor YidD [Brucepastera parasyntrophica]ULQ58660.1 membrane protein insertion efficiency factor YidD [Brucepastera parasyntrophica]